MSLTPVSTVPAVQRALGFAAKDLAGRLAQDAQKYGRTAQTITFRYRFVTTKEVGFNISARSLPVPSANNIAPFSDALVTAAIAIFKKNSQPPSWQLRWISFTATRFTAPATNNLDKLFRSPAALQPPPPAAAGTIIKVESDEEENEDERRGSKRERQ